MLKGKILVLGKKLCFNYWAILPLQFFLLVLNPTNEISHDLNIIEYLDTNTNLF